MEIEENGDLINKKAFKDQFITFFLAQFWSSLSHTLGHLEHSWSTLALDQGNQRKDKEGKGKQGRA